ncbi:hypothetical protein VK792_09805 [Mesobacterium sp. TK19101]|uniref:Aminomethyltransferase folate-binding domain-containing protein n=1 Tax=Mesobacterium hydrothermale TaxID=3111907 RepID=A0ABU6HJF9_9RHOB|nr:hypothetical protein [Mesobacterium sp. TK19101]MEC3861578.1 hypothetical protein [Mesobacterium sp. TK19101]
MVERDWASRMPDPGATLTGEGLLITCHRQAGATLVSGDLDAALAALAPGASMLGLLDPVPTVPFVLRIARDRALVCSDRPLGISGWHDSFAASSADDLYLEITVTGPRASEVVAACLSAPAGSPSTATLFAGIGALVAGLPDGVSLRVQTPDAAALWAHLARLIAVL